MNKMDAVKKKIEKVPPPGLSYLISIMDQADPIISGRSSVISMMYNAVPICDVCAINFVELSKAFDSTY